VLRDSPGDASPTLPWACSQGGIAPSSDSSAGKNSARVCPSSSWTIWNSTCSLVLLTRVSSVAPGLIWAGTSNVTWSPVADAVTVTLAGWGGAAAGVPPSPPQALMVGPL
jgi:hypothetical protein